MSTTKVVINRCFGGFSLSETAQEMLIDIGWSEEDIFDLNWQHENRSKADLVAVVEALGVEASGSYAELKVVGSTDMGNVSYLVPSIHPMIAVAPYGTPIHTPEFATHAKSDSGDKAVIDGAKIMAMTIVDLWANRTTMDAAQSEFATALKNS